MLWMDFLCMCNKVYLKVEFNISLKGKQKTGLFAY